MVIRATGLGAVTFDETQPVTQELNVPADVIVGNKLATVITKLRAAGFDEPRKRLAEGSQHVLATFSLRLRRNKAEFQTASKLS